MTNEEKTDEENRKAFIHWQTISITQLGYAVNLILGLAVAALGFGASLLFNKDKDFVPILWQKCIFSLSLLVLLASIGLAIWCVVNRLRDFRLTTMIARKKQKKVDSAELDSLRRLSDILGERTWNLFWWQIGSFTAGIVAMVLSMVVTIATKLL